MRNNGREIAAGGRRGAEAGGGGGGGSLAVAVDRGKASRCALRWVLENVVSRDQIVKLVHVLQRAPPPSPPHPFPDRSSSLSEIRQPDGPTAELLLPFRCYCMRRQVQCEAIVIEDLDVARGLVKFVSCYAVQNLFLGAASKSFSRLFKNVDTPSTVMKSAPDFCNVYMIGKGKVTGARTASRSATAEGPRLDGVRQLRRGSSSETMYDEISESENEVMCVDSRRPSTDSNFLAFYENLGSPMQDDPGTHWGFKEQDFDPDPVTVSKQRVDPDPDNDDLSTALVDKDARVQASNNGLMEEETRRLAAELHRTMYMYREACEEATVAKQMILELARCKMEAERKMQDAQLAERAAMSMLEKEKARCQEALDAARAAQRLAGRELQRRLREESRAFREAEEKRRMMGDAGLSGTVVQWRSLFHISVALVLLYVYFPRFLGEPSP